MTTDGTLPSLVELCLQSAVPHEFWRVQRRQLACLPEDAANELLRRLLEQRRVSAPQLELFQHCVTSVDLAGSAITGSFLSYLGTFSALHRLSLQRCARLRDVHLQHLEGLAPTLQVLDLSGCSGLADGAGVHLALLTGLRSLNVSATGLGVAATRELCTALTGLTSLNLADVPASDACCEAAGRHMTQLERLVLSATAVGEESMRHLEHLSRLTALDLSFTQVHCPPLCTTLRHLSMNSCALGLAEASVQEALWMQLGASLPLLEDIQLASTTMLPEHGEELLQRLLAGAAGSLRQLDLRDSEFGGSLAALVGASNLTRLDLSGTAVADSHLADLALLPLAWSSFAGTAVGDDGVAQLVAMTSLSRLDLSNCRVEDGSWAVLAQLPRLSWLDLHCCSVALASLPPGIFEALTYLNLNGSQLDVRGCRNLAASAPQLQELWLGSRTVEDKGLRALRTLPKLERLHLSSCGISGPGLSHALPRCPRLRHLALNNCWLVGGEAGVQAAVAASFRAGNRLSMVTLDGSALPLPQYGAAGTATPGGKRPSSGGGGTATRGSLAPASPSADAAGAGTSVRHRAATVLPAEVLAHDERLAYSREEMLLINQMPGPAARAEAQQHLRQRLPHDLRSPQ